MIAQEKNWMIWNADSEKWTCPKCGGQEFFQHVEAQNRVTFRTGDAATLIESDFLDTWEVTDRHAITCDQCSAELDLPEEVTIVEKQEGQDGDR